MKRLFLLAVLTLFFLGATSLQAQTVYNTTAPFTCLGVSHYPITNFGGFDCRGVSYHDSNGKLGAETFVPEFEIFTPSWSISSLHSNLIVTSFKTPENGEPGTFSYTWSGTDTNGNPHNGTATGTWTEITDWRGWYHAVIRSSSLTVDQ
jgi:hypothetical protein